MYKVLLVGTVLGLAAINETVRAQQGATTAPVGEVPGQQGKRGHRSDRRGLPVPRQPRAHKAAQLPALPQLRARACPDSRGKRAPERPAGYPVPRQPRAHKAAQLPVRRASNAEWQTSWAANQALGDLPLSASSTRSSQPLRARASSAARWSPRDRSAASAASARARSSSRLVSRRSRRPCSSLLRRVSAANLSSSLRDLDQEGQSPDLARASPPALRAPPSGPAPPGPGCLPRARDRTTGRSVADRLGRDAEPLGGRGDVSQLLGRGTVSDCPGPRLAVDHAGATPVRDSSQHGQRRGHSSIEPVGRGRLPGGCGRIAPVAENRMGCAQAFDLDRSRASVRWYLAISGALALREARSLASRRWLDSRLSSACRKASAKLGYQAHEAMTRWLGRPSTRTLSMDLVVGDDLAFPAVAPATHARAAPGCACGRTWAAPVVSRMSCRNTFVTLPRSVEV